MKSMSANLPHSTFAGLPLFDSDKILAPASRNAAGVPANASPAGGETLVLRQLTNSGT